jgi:glycosyltransferase involved in cell wall biosynthesis/2-polyprenyl-3-methyl-5-hydroxy-6-metoxy-1,4-benzoquinol methylase
MRLTACSIVKNEEKNIARSIKSYQQVVDEIIIVDTGSTDNTVSICEELGAKVLYYEWHNDFAAAKNFALDHAQGEWVIFLDADEWFVPELNDNKIFNVLRYAESRKYIDVLRTTLCNVEETTGIINSKTATGRILKNDPNLRYVGKIHEDLRKNGVPVQSAFLDTLEIYHSGYSKDRVSDKSKRNLESLYEIYRSGKAEPSTYFYLCRENYILRNIDEALRFYEIFMNLENVDQIIQFANVFTSIYEFGIKLKLSKSEKFTRRDIKETIDVAMQKYPQLPMHSYLEGCYYVSYDLKKALQSFEKAIELHKSYEKDYINNFESVIYDTYLRMARIHKVYQNQEKVFDYLVLALQNQPLQQEAFKEMLPLIGNEDSTDIILFLNKIYNVKNKEHITFLAKQLMFSRCHQVFLYYTMKYNKEFDGQDETTYVAMMLTGEIEKAVKTAMTAYFNAGKEDDRYFATLAILYGKRKDLFEKYRINLNPTYSQIINRVLNEEKLNDPSAEELNAWIHLYSHMFYLAKTEDRGKVENLFEDMSVEIVATITQRLLAYQDYTTLISKCEYLKEQQKHDKSKLQINKLFAFSYYHTKDYEVSLDYFKNLLEDKSIDMDSNILIYLKILSDKVDNEVVKLKAAKLYIQYEPLFMKHIQVIDMLRTNKLEKLEGDNKSLDIKDLSSSTLIQAISKECIQLPQIMLENLFNLIEKYLEEEMDEEAWETILILLRNNFKKDIMYYRLGEIATRQGNAKLSLYCHKQVFGENAAFAATLIQDEKQEKKNYIYKEIPVREVESCPICGQKKKIHSVFNTLPSSDFEQGDLPIKVWKYCEECRHKFAAQMPKGQLVTLKGEGARECVKQISKNIVDKAIRYDESLNLLTQYAKGYKLLDIGSGEGSFMAAAMEYGFDVQGVEPDRILAEKSSKLLDVTVGIGVFEEWVSEEKYSVISMSCLLENIQKPKQVLQKAFNMLNDEGILYIETPNCDSAFARGIKDRCATLRSPRMLNYFSKQSLIKVLSSCGFEVLTYRMSKRNKGYMEVIARK